MAFHIIGDQDTVLGYRFAGVTGVVAENRAEALAAFRDALLHGKDTGFDVYHAVETAAPAILAADSIDQGSQPLRVPDFRPGPHRPAGQAPKEA